MTDKKVVANQKFIDTILKNENRIDVLINNAGYGEYGPVEDLSMEKRAQAIRNEFLWRC